MRAIGKYAISRALGGSGSSVCFEATDGVLGRPVVLRSLAPSLAADPVRRAQLLDSAAACARLRHLNIAKIYDIGDHGGLPYVVMERVDGVDLATLLGRGGASSAEWKLQVVTQICEGLAYAHKNGVLHLDLRPANIYLTSGGEVKIAGFGVAPFRGRELPPSNEALDEILYAAPELLAGGPSDARTDVFSIAAVAYELFANRRAFDGATREAAIAAVVRCRPDLHALPRTEYSPRLESILAGALSPSPENRPASAEALCSELAGLASDTAALFFERMLESADSPGSAGEVVPGAPEREGEIQRLYGVALVQAAEGRLEEALKLTRAIRTLAPHDPRNDEMMAYLAEMADRAEVPRPEARPARSGPDALARRALERYLRDDVIGARIALERALALDPRHERAGAIRSLLSPSWPSSARPPARPSTSREH